MVTAKTRDGVPSPPVNLTATQAWREMILTWGWPASPQGEIQVFVIRVFQDGDKRQELDKLVTAKDQDKKRVEFTVHGLQERESYEVEVVAVNEEHQSSPITRVRLSMSKRLGDIELQETGEDFLIISWSSDGHYRYNVSYISDKQKA